MKKQIIRIIIALLIISLLVVANGGLGMNIKGSTVRAVGDLSVDWGVPEGSPIFVVHNMIPGQMEERTVHLVNNATSARPVAIRGIEASNSGTLKDALEIVINQAGTDLYGGSTGIKTLTQFFADSVNIEGIPLSLVGPGISTAYSLKVTFKGDAGNEFQNTNAIFDLKIGIAFKVPQQCKDITFDGDPIFGTQGNDIIRGGNKNQLIIGFEGDDWLEGRNGNDCIIAGGGNNTLRGGNGHDVIIAGDGNNSIDGGNGDDTIIAGGGSNRVRGGNGSDTITVGSGNNVLYGENGADKITTGGGNNKLYGGNGNDMLLGGSGSNFIDGGLGVDTCVGTTKVNCEL